MDKVIVFIDGACEPNNRQGVAAYGFVIHHGDMRWEGSELAAEPRSELATNNVAEYMAFIMAMEKVIELGLNDSDVEVRSDSNLIINQFNGKYKVGTPHLKRYYEQARNLSSKIKSVQLKKIPREENEADALAKACCKSNLPKINGTTHVPTTESITQQGAVTCRQCGARIPMDSKFCKECGTKIE